MNDQRDPFYVDQLCMNSFPYPGKYRAQAATDGPFVRAPIHAPRWKSGYSPLGSWGGWGGRGRVEVVTCWNKSTSLSWGGSVRVLGEVGLLIGALPVLLPYPLGFSLLFS